MEQNNPYVEEINKIFAELSNDISKLGEEYKAKIEKLNKDYKK